MTTDNINIRVTGDSATTCFDWLKSDVNFSNLTMVRVKTQQVITNDRRPDGTGRNMFHRGVVISPQLNPIQPVKMINGRDGKFFTFRLVENGTSAPENFISAVIQEASTDSNQLTIIANVVNGERYYMPKFRNITGEIAFTWTNAGEGTVTITIDPESIELTKDNPSGSFSLPLGRHVYMVAYASDSVASNNNYGEIDVDDPPVDNNTDHI